MSESTFPTAELASPAASPEVDPADSNIMDREDRLKPKFVAKVLDAVAAGDDRSEGVG